MVRAILSFLSLLLWAPALALAQAGGQGGVGILLATGELSYLEDALDVGIAALRSA